ncbi:MAG: hypothetical protein WC976_06350 [Caldisericia bacterium]
MRRYDRFIITKDIEIGKEVIKKGEIGQEVKMEVKSSLVKFIICGRTGEFGMRRSKFLRKTKVANL